jgi:hypothetical protein
LYPAINLSVISSSIVLFWLTNDPRYLKDWTDSKLTVFISDLFPHPYIEAQDCLSGFTPLAFKFHFTAGNSFPFTQKKMGAPSATSAAP